MKFLSRILTVLFLPNIPYTYPRGPPTNFPLETDHPTNSSIICVEKHIPHYVNLQIAPSVSQAQVATAYRALIRLLHPDKSSLKHRRWQASEDVDVIVDEDQNRQNKIRAYGLVRKAWAILGISAKRQAYTFGNYYLDGYDEVNDDEVNNPLKRFYRSLGEKVKEKNGKGNNDPNQFVERIYGDVENRFDCIHWIMGEERLVYKDDFDVDVDADADADDYVDGNGNTNEVEGEIKNDWKCWESALRDLDGFVRGDEYNRRRFVWEKSGSPYPHHHSHTTNHPITFPTNQKIPPLSISGSIPTERDRFAYMFDVEEEERKPWFWDYTIVPRRERGNHFTCALGWVNLVHIFADNLLAREGSDKLWGWAEWWRAARAVKGEQGGGRSVKKAKKRLVPKTLTFWENCESFDVVIWVWEVKGNRENVGLGTGGEMGLGIGYGRTADRWSNRRSDTRWSTLGKDLFCWDVWGFIWIVIGGVIWMMGRGCWWLVRGLWRVVRNVWKSVKRDKKVILRCLWRKMIRWIVWLIGKGKG